jgi:hypothetical protein
MAVKVGKNASVKIGTSAVAEMGTWSLDGITNELLESTAFGDEFKEYVLGVGDYGGISFSGNFDMTDTNGQLLLDSALRNKAVLTSLRLYIDNTSFYIPNTNFTSSGGATGAGILLQTIAIAFDKAGIGTISFTGKCTGPMMLL